jgi:abequosyltransferase
MTTPRLSICIATYNRAKYIAETLESIISQVTDEVEVIVVDGASTDHTSSVVKEYADICKQIRYICLPSKGGVDQDYCKAVELVEGKYCWLFTDDDILKPGAVQAVLTAMLQDYGLILVNAEIRNINLSNVLKERYLNFLNNRVYKKECFEQLFMDVADYLSFIGGVVIKKSLWDSREKKVYFGTAFVHVGVIFQSPFTDETMVLADPLISIRYGNASWTDKSFEISLFKWPDLIWSFSHFSESARSRVHRREPWRSMKSLLMYRARGLYSRTEFNKYLVPRLPNPAERFILRIIAQLPGIVLNWSLYKYFRVFRFHYSHSEPLLVELENSKYFYRKYICKLKEKYRTSITQKRR